MMNPRVSLFASAVRPKLWPSFFKSLEGTSVEWEVIFVGPVSYENIPSELYLLLTIGKFTLIETKNIKPSQCYEIARRHCIGEVVVWIADDCEFPNDVIGKSYDYWKSKNNEKLILSIQTKESGYGNPEGSLFNMNDHTFFGGDPYSPLMAPLGMISREFLDELGGIDQKYVSGQYENDIIMRSYAQGAKVEIFGDKDCYIDIDHLGKSIAIGESWDQESFLKRPFATGFLQDRKTFENSWCKFNPQKLARILKDTKRKIYPSDMHDMSLVQLDNFEPYPENIPLDHSLSNKGKWDEMFKLS